MTQPEKPPTPWAEMSEGQRSAVRAQAYPDVIDDKGREWKIGMIEDQRERIAALEREVKRLRGALAFYAKALAFYADEKDWGHVARAALAPDSTEASKP